MNSDFENRLLDVINAINKGDFTCAMEETGTEEQRQVASAVNGMVMRLNALSSEIRRVSREIGTFGSFGGQSEVYGLEGGWKELESDFNSMACSLTCQLRDFASVTREALAGKPARPASAPSRGETRQLKEQLNQILLKAEPVGA